MPRLPLLFLAIALSSTPSMAQGYIGWGSDSCGSWSQERRANSRTSQAQKAWILGYVSAVNISDVTDLKTKDFLRRTDESGIVGWIDNYCASHPLDDLLVATIKLIGVLRRSAF
jgi:hypothetical protein